MLSVESRSVTKSVIKARRPDAHARLAGFGRWDVSRSMLCKSGRQKNIWKKGQNRKIRDIKCLTNPISKCRLAATN